MIEILRKLALMGLGVISLSEEKLKSLIKEMEEKGGGQQRRRRGPSKETA